MKYFSLLMPFLLLSLSNLTFAQTTKNHQAETRKLAQCDTTECHNRFLQYKRYSKKGYSDAMFVLAEFYYVGYGTEANTERDLKLFRKAAKFDSPQAQYKAGIIYLKEGENQDIDRGVKYLTEAGDNNLAPASHLLGLLYWEGTLVEQDLKKVTTYFQSAYKKQYRDTINFVNLNKDKPPFDQMVKADIAKETLPPESEMERIQVVAPKLEEVFDYHLALMDTFKPDAAKSTGSSIAGRNCADTIACSVVTDRNRVRDFFMIGW